MKNTVVIKGNKAGMTVILDPEVPYETLLLDIAAKFEESARFWGAAQMTLTLAGRPLTPEQEMEIVGVITGHSQIEILCLVDQDINRIRRCEKALNEKLMELSAATGQFYRGNLTEGTSLESETSIVIIGDVERGAKVVAKGNVIVLGEVKGSVTAGASGNGKAVVVGLEMAPAHIRIADYASRFKNKGKRLAKGPVMICVENEMICVKPFKKNIFHLLKFN